MKSSRSRHSFFILCLNISNTHLCLTILLVTFNEPSLSSSSSLFSWNLHTNPPWSNTHYPSFDEHISNPARLNDPASVYKREFWLVLKESGLNFWLSSELIIDQLEWAEYHLIPVCNWLFGGFLKEKTNAIV